MTRDPNDLGSSLSGAAGKESLTQQFNRSAGMTQNGVPLSQLQIIELRKKLSQPRFTSERLTLGSVNNAYDPHRDRKIKDQIKAIQQALNKHKDLARSSFAKAQQHGQAKSAFNRAAGMGR